MTASTDPELTETLAALVRLPSPSGGEAGVQAWIAEWFSANGIEARLEPAADRLVNVIAEVRADAPGRTLFIGGHVDTVSPSSDWTLDPHAALVRDGRLYGVGAMDMKSGIATAMHAVRDLARQPSTWAGRVVFGALADEEAYSRGARAYIAGRPAIDAAIMCEPHFDNPGLAGMGKINIKVTVTGRSAHGSQPWNGVNAVTEAARLLVAIDGMPHASHPVYGRGSHCVLNVSSGDGAYEIRVPDHCGFLVNWHLLPGEAPEDALALVQELATALRSDAGFAVSLTEPRYDAFVLSEDHAIVAAFRDSYQHCLGREPAFEFCFGVSDANIFNGLGGIPTLLFGPGGANLHAADEWADLAQMSEAKAVYVDLAKRFLDLSRQGH